MEINKSGFEALKYYYENRYEYAKAWKAEGKKVIGYMCNCVPEEMIMAAGCLPYRISGDPTKRVNPAVFAGRPVDVCLTNIMSMIYEGYYDFCDYIIIPRSRSNVDSVYGVLAKLREMDPNAKIPELYNFKRTQTTFASSLEFDKVSYARLKAKIEEWSGNEITDAALKDAIAVCNETRTLLKQLEELRAQDDLPVSGTAAMQMIAPAMFMDKAEYNKLLKEALANLPANESGKVRMYIGGGPKDNTELYEVVESCGATIVGEDHCWGNRYSDSLVDETIADPMHAIFKRYMYLKGCPYVYPMQTRIDYDAKSAAKAKAEAAVFSGYKNDTQNWDIPSQIEAVKATGAKVIFLQKQPYSVKGSEAVKEAVSKLVADCQ